jgi:hypothetical protein
LKARKQAKPWATPLTKPELHGFWHYWHFLIFSSIRLTDERRRPAMPGTALECA